MLDGRFTCASMKPGSDAASRYWLTRWVILRWLGFVYLIAFYVAARQLVPLVGGEGLTPGALFLHQLRAHFGSTWAGFQALPTLFWLNDSDAALRIVSWAGVALSLAVVAGFANAPVLALLWIFDLSIVHIGQDWYGYGWEIQLLETGFLAIFLCPLLDARPFPKRPPPLPVILLFRWLIIRIMLGSALIKLRGDSSWRDLTALIYFFETQPIPNPVSRWFHFLPHPLLAAGVLWMYLAELVAPWFAFGPRQARLAAGIVIVSFQGVLIICGNLSFFNWLTIVPALACFDDRFWHSILPAGLVRCARRAEDDAQPSRPMAVVAWVVAGVVALLSLQPVFNLLSPRQMMNSSFDPLHLVNTYGAFGSVGVKRYAIVFEGTADSDPAAAHWKEYPFQALPDDPARPLVQVAPYQPHLDWQLWFAAMGTPEQYPWTLNLVWKLLHNDAATLSLFAGNPFPDAPPRFIRASYYIYHFAPPDNPAHVYWTRERIGSWLPPLARENKELRSFLEENGWLKTDAKM